MTLEKWTEVDEYLNHLFAASDPILDAALRDAEEAGLPAIQVTPTQGMLLNLLARAIRAQRILEIGTLGGYSTIWLARALPVGGRLVTLEVNPVHSEVARNNLRRAGLDRMVESSSGRRWRAWNNWWNRIPTCSTWCSSDADKPNYPNYLRLVLQLCRTGSLIVADNVIRNGEIVDGDGDDPSVQAMRVFNTALASEPRLVATAIQTVGSKGYDGFAIALVTAETT